jgi:hypothetical protein
MTKYNYSATTMLHPSTVGDPVLHTAATDEADDKIIIVTSIEGITDPKNYRIEQTLRQKNVPLKKFMKKTNGGIILHCETKTNTQQALDILNTDFGQSITIKEDTALTEYKLSDIMVKSPNP